MAAVAVGVASGGVAAVASVGDMIISLIRGLMQLISDFSTKAEKGKLCIGLETQVTLELGRFDIPIPLRVPRIAVGDAGV